MENPSDATQQLPPLPVPPRRLVRRPNQGPLGGVCAGVAEYFNVDPTIVRIAAVVLAFMGPGVPGYLIAWAFVPKDDGASIAATVGPGAGQRDRGTQILGIVLMVVAVSILWGDWWIPGKGWLVPLGLIGLGAWLLLRDDESAPLVPPVPPAPPVPPVPPTPWAGGTAPWATPAPPVGGDATTDAGAALDASSHDPADADADADPTLTQPVDGGEPPLPPSAGIGGIGGPTGPTPGPVGPRRRVVGPIVFGALFIWGGLSWLLSVQLETALAVGLCIVGLGFVLGAFIGGSWALLPPAILLAIALVFTSIVDIPFEGGIGEKQWRPVRSTEVRDTYELGIGEGTLDLTDLELRAGEDVDIRVHQGIGHLLVFVPADIELDIDAEVGMGQADVLGRRDDGVGVELRRQVDGDRTNGSIDLDLDLGIGHLEVIAVGSSGDPEVEVSVPESVPTIPALPR